MIATKTDGTVWVWGDNDYGNLGTNNRTFYSSPIQIPGVSNAKYVDAYFNVTSYMVQL